MKYQLLISTMNKEDYSFIQEMKLDSDALIINQADRLDYSCQMINGNTVEMYSFNERGIGLSRNSALMRSHADIIEFADDDMVFVDHYSQLVVNEFEMHPKADAILFSIHSMNPKRPLHTIHTFKRIHTFEGRKYGCARLAVRRNSLIYNNIAFSLLFGGGARYGAGEDTILINDMIRSGLKVYVSPVKIADVKQEDSSWFKGHNEKFYFDKGALMCAIYPRSCRLLAFFFSVYHSKFNLKNGRMILNNYLKGISDYSAMKKRR